MNVSDKKMIKCIIQFVSFRKNKVAEVGKVAMDDTHLPYEDQGGANLEGSLFKAHWIIEEIEGIIKLDTSAEDAVPEHHLQVCAGLGRTRDLLLGQRRSCFNF
jgi:hypothetical protein